MANSTTDTEIIATDLPRHTTKTAYMFGLSLGLLVLLFTAVSAKHHMLSGLQARLFYDFDNLQLNTGFATLAKILTEALGAIYPIVLCTGTAAALKRYRLAWLYFVTAGADTVLFYVIKKTINEPRPIVLLHGHLLQRVIETGPGFPSGHVAMATALALTTVLILPKKLKWLAGLWIAIVAFSRLYLGVHTPDDVLGGIAVGLIIVSAIQLLPIAIRQKFKLI